MKISHGITFFLDSTRKRCLKQSFVMLVLKLSTIHLLFLSVYHVFIVDGFACTINVLKKDIQAND